MENFSVNLDDVPRLIASGVPKVKVVGYVKRNFFPPREYSPRNIDIGLVLSSDEPVMTTIYNGEAHACATPSVQVEFPGTVYRAAPRAAWEVFYFAYDQRHSPFFRTLELTPETVVPWTIELTPAVRDLVAKLSALAVEARAHGAAGRIDRYGDLLLHELLLQRSRHAAPASPEEAKIRSIASYIEAHCAEPVDLKNLPRRHGLSNRSFYRRWKQLFGVSPVAFIERARLNYARHLLTVTALKVHEVAAEVGFADPLYFTKRFHQDTGMTPTGYRLGRKP